jgi:hypothetical protein
MSSPKCKSEEESDKSTKRLKRRHEPIVCNIELENGLITKELMARLVCEIFKYLLYDRQQIPFPLTNSQSLLQLNQKSITSQLTPREELILQMVHNLDKLFDELICVMKIEEIEVECVCLSFGQTLQMPKELYCIEMPSIDCFNKKHSINCNTISLRCAVTRFFKTILNDGNILFLNRKDIPITKLFLLLKINRSFVSILNQHSLKYHLISDESEEQLFTPHIDYELPQIGNRFKFVIKQKPCNCDSELNEHYFQIYDENNEHKNDENYVEEVLSKTMSDLTVINNESKDESVKEDFIWIQIRSSIKGVQYNYTNKNSKLLTDF